MVDNKTILDFLMKVSVDFNLHENKYWGVAFLPGKAMIGSEWFSLSVEGDVHGESPFFSYFENKWMPAVQYPYPPDYILSVLYDQIDANEFKVVVPYTNMVNFLNSVMSSERQACRIVFSQSRPIMSGEVLLKFDIIGGVRQSKVNGVEKPFVIAPNSFISPANIDSKSFYRCIVVGETESSYMISAAEKYGIVRAGILYSPEGYLPEDINAVNQLDGFPTNRIFPINQIQYDLNAITMSPVHLDLTVFDSLFRAMGISESAFISLEFNRNPNSPIIMRSIPENPEQPRILAKVATLNPTAIGQKR